MQKMQRELTRLVCSKTWDHYGRPKSATLQVKEVLLDSLGILRASQLYMYLQSGFSSPKKSAICQ